MDKYGEEEGGIHFPLEEWQALAMINDIKMMQELPDWKQKPPPRAYKRCIISLTHHRI